MTKSSKRVLSVLGLIAALAAAGSAPAQTTTYDLRDGEVISVTGNQLIVKGPEGVKEFIVSDDFRFDLNGQPVSVHELKPGMKLTALITTTTTPVDLQATELRDAEVIFTNGASIVVKNSADGKYRRFTNAQMQEMDLVVYKDGRVVSPSSLRKGDRISAVVVTKLPPAELTEREVMILAQNPTAIPPGAAPARKVTTQNPAIVPPIPQPPPEPPAPPPPPPPKALPKTASPLPLVGLMGAAALAAAAGLTLRRRLAGR
jgi:hypothetical protein